jgi:hypothetical protein
VMTVASEGRNEAVSNKKINSTENRSTIGVMSMCGVRTGALIFGMAIYFKLMTDRIIAQV